MPAAPNASITRAAAWMVGWLTLMVVIAVAVRGLQHLVYAQHGHELMR